MGPPYSHRITRVRQYSGSSLLALDFIYMALTFSGRPSHAVRLSSTIHFAVRTPKVFLPQVWPLPRSLATTGGISVDFSSSPYLDVSVQAVPFIRLCIYRMIYGLDPIVVPQFGYLRIIDYLHLPAAFRSLSRPSSAPSAKAFPLCSF